MTAAQEPLTFAPPAPQHGPVTGMPFQAVRLTKVVKTLSNGTLTTMEFQGRTARDSAGRVFTEVQMVQSGAKTPALTIVVDSVFDPAAHTLLQWSNGTKTARLLRLPDFTAGAPKPDLSKGTKPSESSSTAQDLGHRMIAGLLTSGKRTTQVIPSGRIGNSEPLTVTRETWTADELKVVVSETTDDPKEGKRTSELQDIQRTEPDPSLFHVPEGYEVTETTLGAKPPVDTAKAASMSYEEALTQLDSGDKRLGAAALVRIAQQDPKADTKDDVAYRLARANLNLDDAQALAVKAIEQIENEAASFNQDKLGKEDFERMVTLSRYWHTLGWVYFRKGDFEKARLYVEAAWNLEPRAYYGDHLGRIYEDQGDTKTAIRYYQMALAAPGSDKETQIIKDRLTALAGQAVPNTSSSSIALPEVKASSGIALFDIVMTHDGPPKVQFVSGSDSLSAAGPEIAQSGLKAGLPDAGPEKVVRRGRVSCGASANAGCEMTLLSAEEARKAPQS
jgi:tetratricopeptide (TPR) repeat protein